MLVCPFCSHENPDGQRFCGQCGTMLEASPFREERKVVTALFCDVVGSTALGERLDAEDISRLLRGYEQICRKRIESRGGVIEKFIGDGVVGVFGIPLAHEDDPERAVRAALLIIEDVEASGLGIEVRIGVNTGEALVRLDVDPRSGEGFVTGDTMNTAARLEAGAPVMGVAVGAGTYQGTVDRITYEELPSISAKGKAEPLKAWQAMSPSAQGVGRDVERTPFVGRDLELEMLMRLFERCRTRPSTEFVTVIAEPGIGKSRLVREFARLLGELPEPVVWREGRCLPYGDGITFWALGEIVKAQAGILETDDQATSSLKLDRALTDTDADTRSWIKDRLAPLVGLDSTTEPPEQEEAFTAWRRFLEVIAIPGPAVLVVEDLHWADAAFVAFLEHIAERTHGLPLLVVVTARPEVEDRHPSWPPGRSTVMSLPPLQDRDLEQVIKDRLPATVDARLVGVVLERAGGSPLFAEQLAAVLRENLPTFDGDAFDEAVIPASLQALIAARIDGLPREPRRVLMEASVVGKTFWAGAIAAAGIHQDLEGSLAELGRREFCRPLHPSTMQGDSEFVFWHALVRDVAYAELTKAERAHVHATTARWIADRTEGTLGEHAEIVVHHLDTALEFIAHAPDLDQAGLRDLLADSLCSAGDAAMHVDVRRAIPFVERALTMLGDDDDRFPSLLLQLGRGRMATGNAPGAASVLERLVQFYEAEGRIDSALDAAMELSDALWRTGEGTRGDALVESMGDRLGDLPTPTLARLKGWKAFQLMSQGSYEASAVEAREALAVANRLDLPAPSRALAVLGLSTMAMGDPTAEQYVRSAVEQLVAEGDVRSAAARLYNLANAVEGIDPRRAIAIAGEAVDFADRFGLEGEGWSIRAGRLVLLADQGMYEDVLNEAGPLMEWAIAHEDSFAREMSLVSVALTELDRGGHSVDPHELADLSQRLATRGGLLVAAEVALADGEVEFARELLPGAADSASPSNAHALAQACVDAGLVSIAEAYLGAMEPADEAEQAARLAGHAILAEAAGDLRAAKDGYAEAVQLFGSERMPPDHARCLQALGRCLIALGETMDGRARLREARSLWGTMGAVVRIEEVDTLLEAG